MKTRMSLVTDWRTRDEDLPDVLPGEEYERVITPQKHVTLCRILVNGLHLVRLQIGAVEEVPFRLMGVDGRRRGYSPRIDLVPRRDDDDSLRSCAAREKLLQIQSIPQPTVPDEVAILAGVNVHITLRNERAVPVKPRAALLVREEISC